MKDLWQCIALLLEIRTCCSLKLKCFLNSSKKNSPDDTKERDSCSTHKIVENIMSFAPPTVLLLLGTVGVLSKLKARPLSVIVDSSSSLMVDIRTGVGSDAARLGSSGSSFASLVAGCGDSDRL